MITYDDIKSKVLRLEADRALAKRRAYECRQAYSEAKANLKAMVRAQEIIQHVAQDIQARVFGTIADVVTHCLKSVFGDTYRFIVDFQRKRNRTEAELYLEKDGERFDPLSATGGGIVDVASFALRLVSILLAAGRTRRILILDEPFKFLSAEYRERARDMLEAVANEMGFQIIMVTHIDEFRLGKVIEIKKA